jgi:hypothetical protein
VLRNAGPGATLQPFLHPCSSVKIRGQKFHTAPTMCN